MGLEKSLGVAQNGGGICAKPASSPGINQDQRWAAGSSAGLQLIQYIARLKAVLRVQFQRIYEP
jgi:hypothetical protein